MGVVCGGFDGSDGGRKLERAEEGQTMIIGAPSGALLVLPPRWGGMARLRRRRGRVDGWALWARPPAWPGVVVAGVARPVPASLSPRHCPRGGAGLEGRAATASFSGAVPVAAPPLGRCPFPVVPDRPWGRRRCGPGMVPGAWGPGAGVRPWPPEAAPDGCPALFRGSAGLVVGDAGEFGLGVGVAFLVGAYPFVAVVGGVQFVPLVGVWVVP